MITLSDFEKYATYKIWTHGEDYYDSGAVADLEENDPGEWTAQVWGTMGGTGWARSDILAL